MDMDKIVVYGFGELALLYNDILGDYINFYIDNDAEKQKNEMVYGHNKIKECINLHEWIVITAIESYGQIVDRLISEGIDRWITHIEIVDYIRTGRIPKCIDNRDSNKLRQMLQAISELIYNSVKPYKSNTSLVEFYLVDSFEISHYIPFIDALINKGIDVAIVAEHPIINSGGAWFDYTRAISMLQKMNREFYTLSNVESKVVFTTQRANLIMHYNNAKKIQLSYGVALLKKSAFQFFAGGPNEFDYVFVHGQLQRELLKEINGYDRGIDVSFPRYKNLIYSSVNHSNRPTIVYFPTWDEYSTIYDISRNLASLRYDFRLVVKPHHCTIKEQNGNEMLLLNECFEIVLDGSSDIAEASYMADIAVCDAKSAVANEVVFLNRDIKLLYVYKNCTASDFFVDLSCFAHGVKYNGDVIGAIRSLNEKDDFIENRKRIIDKMFSSDFDKGMERALEVITSAID